jgi:trimethylamine--corrinoid protein Co-methyltransferase
MDPETHCRSRFVSENVKVTAALCDALPHFHWSMFIGMADDVPPDVADRVIARYVMEYCEKPVAFCSKDTSNSKDIFEMALLLCGGREKFENVPCLLHYSEPISPLAYYGPAVDKIMYCAKNNIPVINSPAPQACGTAPATLAGIVVQGNAETLSGLVLHQLTKPGAPFIAGAFTTIMDMRTTVFSYGACEMSLMTAALAQMAQHYKLPFFGTAGATDSKFCDAQAGTEAAFQILTAAATGSGLVHDCGSWMDHGSLASPEFMVLVNEIVDAVDHFMKGIPLSEESLALDLIHKVGPAGNFIQEAHTLDHFREIRYSELFDRSILDEWKKTGEKQFEQRLQELTLEKMKHRPEPLPDDVTKELDRMQASWR